LKDALDHTLNSLYKIDLALARAARNRISKRIPLLAHYGAEQFGGFMSAVADQVLSIPKPEAPSSNGIWVPLLGGLWVLVNVALAALGIYIDWPILCAFLAGLMNGSLLSVIVVSTASDRFQASTTGLLGGLSLSALRSDGSMVWKAMQSVHGFVDKVFLAMGFELNERMHHAIEQETLYMIWTIVLVVLASLVAAWVRSSRTQTDHER
jgi:hypothetical protein